MLTVVIYQYYRNIVNILGVLNFEVYQYSAFFISFIINSMDRTNISTIEKYIQNNE